MKLKLIAAVLTFIAIPLCAQAQNPPAKKVTEADAQKVVAIISGDKAKTQIYCDIAKLGDQIEQADQKKDTKKVDELSKKMDDMSQKLGPEYIALSEGLQTMDANSKDGKDIGAALDSLDKLCGK
jgi:ABC-type transporter Mla subunit MlaD